MTPRLAKKLQEEGLKEQLVTIEDLVGRYSAVDLINEKTGEIYVEAGDELTEKHIETVEAAGITTLPTLAIDHINVGPYIRNTLAVDKNTLPRGSADRHLPRHASGRAADAGDGGDPVPGPVLRQPSATISRPSAG